MTGSRTITAAKRVSYALGYIELGLLKEATDELNAVTGADRVSLPVQLARIELNLEGKDWKQLVAGARDVARTDPSQERAWIGWAYGLRCLEQVEEARAVLLEAVRHHGKTCALLHYNLACYECLLGNQKMAHVRLRRACKLGGKHFKTLALDDADLKPMWTEIVALH